MLLNKIVLKINLFIVHMIILNYIQFAKLYYSIITEKKLF